MVPTGRRLLPFMRILSSAVGGSSAARSRRPDIEFPISWTLGSADREG
jgi:hypothetical protein